jgi:hypothetical protein
MQIEVHSPNEPISERMQRYVVAMTREVLRGHEQESDSVIVRLRRDLTQHAGSRRIHCDLRLRRADGAELVFDGVATFAHVAVERALEQLWQVLRAQRSRSNDGRAA